MKFHDLEIGQRFEFDGVVYVKTSPVMAGQAEGGGSKFMARYAMVKLLDDVAPRPRAKPEKALPAGVVLAAFEVYHAACGAIVPDEQRAALESARQTFLAAIGQ